MANGNKGDLKGNDQLYTEVSRMSGVSEDDVKRVLSTLGLDRRLKEATRLLGRAPSVHDLRIAFKISESTVSV